jgi:hypothetical protein
MQNDEELIVALQRAKAQLLNRRQHAGETEGQAIKHNIKNADAILEHHRNGNTLLNVQRELATIIIARANQKERIRL